MPANKEKGKEKDKETSALRGSKGSSSKGVTRRGRRSRKEGGATELTSEYFYLICSCIVVKLGHYFLCLQIFFRRRQWLVSAET